MIFGILRHKKYRQTRFSGSARFFVPLASFPLYPRDSAVQPRPGPADRPRIVLPQALHSPAALRIMINILLCPKNV